MASRHLSMKVLDLIHTDYGEGDLEDELEVGDPHEALRVGSDEEYDELKELEIGTETTVEKLQCLKGGWMREYTIETLYNKVNQYQCLGTPQQSSQSSTTWHEKIMLYTDLFTRLCADTRASSNGH